MSAIAQDVGLTERTLGRVVDGSRGLDLGEAVLMTWALKIPVNELVHSGEDVERNFGHLPQRLLFSEESAEVGEGSSLERTLADMARVLVSISSDVAMNGSQLAKLTRPGQSDAESEYLAKLKDLAGR